MTLRSSSTVIHLSRSIRTLGVAAAVLVAVAGCTTAVTPPAQSTDAGSTSSAKPATNAAATDPCAVISIAALEQLTGLSGLSSQPILGKSKNGCHWGTADGASSVSYDVLPMTGTADSMIARINNAAGGSITASKVDLGNGHPGAIFIIPGSGSVAAAMVDLFLPPDRYAAIVTALPLSSDAGTITLNIGKAFSAVADTLPGAPKI